jgi:hypothetical protein
MTASLRRLPACNTKACGLSRLKNHSAHRGSRAGQFAVEIGLARIRRRQSFGDCRIFMRPVEPGANQLLAELWFRNR